MSEINVHNRSPTDAQAAHSRWPLAPMAAVFAFWLAIYAASLASPPLLDDADATHAQAVQFMLRTGDWVTLHVDGIRYLEKAPLPYWTGAISMKIFGANSFAMHLPLALEVLALALLGYAWARRAFDERTALYTAIFTLTSTGVFLFTRIFIPDVLLSLLLAAALYAALRALDEDSALYAYAFWVLMALAVLTKGLIAVVFLLGTVCAYLVLAKQRSRSGRLRMFRGVLLLLLIAAPWHILAGMRNTGGSNGHGFFWFYFVNEHYLRFLGRRMPRDYNKLPALLYWTQHIVWLFPWSLFAPAALWVGYRKRRELQAAREVDATGERLTRLEMSQRRGSYQPAFTATFAGRTIVLLLLFSAFVIVFFSFSTNQEYYTFPVYMPLLLLTSAALALYEQSPRVTATLQRLILFAHVVFALAGATIAVVLCFGLWRSEALPSSSDIGTLLAHRNIGHYTLSMSHFFDLTLVSLAALRLPATIAAAALLLGSVASWVLRTRRRHLAATLTIACTSAMFLVAAHIALVRFAPILSSQNFAARIAEIDPHQRAEVLIYGDQSFGSSIPFYLGRQVILVDGRTTSMQFGSTFADAPPIFLTHQQLAEGWGIGQPKLLFVPGEQHAQAAHLLGPRAIVVMEVSGKMLLADRPLDSLQ
jgi:4-amino-4-deoxy-L-arabinose transferase-like glycosyltransferase